MSVSPTTLDSAYLPSPPNDTNPKDNRVQDLVLSALSLKADEPKKEKKVSFSETQEFVLISTRQEYSEDGYSSEMWWTDEETSEFYRTSKDEKDRFFEESDLTEMSYSEISKNLYQSDPTVIIANTLTNTIASKPKRDWISEYFEVNRAHKECLRALRSRLSEI